ncbi:dihydrofolate reductase [Westerdykella ornata]|uniref:2,5-diamino-6-ribosylamino-4(3H)-pyrimidinone 5'-phosphate reductase n=1 Tax=Westerdykella ornata TaxID=318751 RepID=A0A6A6JX56_WESOR|nr:dihydrofolate reductase [Westerdykella ornata]KAF2280653.1 dihydrofolate reductase [Westerdykella ornata]
MCRLRYNVAATLDGYIASADHSTSWIIEDPTIDFNALFAEFSTFIMGRRTYETMLSFGDANLLKGLPAGAVKVISSTKSWPGVEVIKNGPGLVERVRQLKGGEGARGKDIWFMGGAKLAGLLIQAGLLDVVEVAIMPVVIGDGVKMVELFPGQTQVQLHLENVEKKESGIIMTRYTVGSRRPV